MSRQNKIQQFVISIYKQACLFAGQHDYNIQSHQLSIVSSLQESAISYKEIKKLVNYTEQDWIQDLLQITADLKAILSNKQKSLARFINRSSMHFGGQHYRNLLSERQQKPTKKILEMYENEQFQWWNTNQDYFVRNVFPNCVYLMGLTKGNGLIVNKQTLVSCAHVMIDDDTQEVFQIRCFANGHGSFGIVKTTNSDLFKQEDVSFSKIIYLSGQSLKQMYLQQPSQLFASPYVPIKCIQLGLLYNPNQFLEPFYASEGFIERNLYKDSNEIKLFDDMGLLVHSCYGLHGTSGSPIWNSKGELLGIHNSWNSQGYNISMIVHDDEENNQIIQDNECRVVRQYERRAISSHVLRILHKKLKKAQQKQNNQDKNKFSRKIKKEKAVKT